MNTEPVSIELARTDLHLLLMALSLARNSPEFARSGDLDELIETIREQSPPIDVDGTTDAAAPGSPREECFR
ncbi:hypothetical protein [Halovivax limisalsi]|uniref:hypothetical protein n=1 Tax=Halovivax limisalsi TaxID=1453760 RepID=UPI001FFDCF81|nr:hypothetical protein [Halovivax limisalsi]